MVLLEQDKCLRFKVVKTYFNPSMVLLELEVVPFKSLNGKIFQSQYGLIRTYVAEKSRNGGC